MLVLTRGRGQKIIIGDDVVMTLIAIRSDGRVLIGVDAPQEVPVRGVPPDREELWRAQHRRELARLKSGPTTGTPPDGPA